MAREAWCGLPFAVALAACAGAGAERAASAPPVDPALAATYAPTSVGVATMKADGSIELMLRAEGDNGQIGDALLLVRPDDARYEAIRKHVGDLKVGESGPVRPWPER